MSPDPTEARLCLSPPTCTRVTMAPCHDGSVQRAGMAIGRRAQQLMVRSCILIYVYVVWMGGAGGVGDGLPMVSRVSL